MSLINRFLQPLEQSYFLFGPRGTGKTTWLQQNYPDALWVDLLDPANIRTYSAKPERFEEIVLATSQRHIIVDEIQKIPELLSVVHRLIEMKKGFQFILTGSSARKLKRSGVDLLAGRALKENLHPFMATELKQDFHLEKALTLGLLPLVIDSPSPRDVLKSYIGLYINEEVRAEGLVRNIGHFSRFLEVMSFSHSSIINLNNIARECEVARSLVEGYLSVLEDLLLSFTVPVFTKRARRATVSHNKFYYFDSGVYHSLRAQGPLDITAEINGAALEGLVAQHLRAWNDYLGTPFKLYYWRTRSGTEVDFIIYGNHGFWAIEVKNSEHIHPKDLNGLKSFMVDYPEAKPLFLYRGKMKLIKNNILCMPINDFLLQLSPQNGPDYLIDNNL